jgi:hypothetical protein
MTGVSVLALTVLPESILHTQWYAVMSSFVAINTILYVTLSIFKILPKVYLSDWFHRGGRRSETRSIYPNGIAIPDGWEPTQGSLAAKHLELAAERAATIPDKPDQS